MILSADGLRVHYQGAPRPSLEGVGLTLAPGELVAVVGPNGSGKTSLLRALTGTVPRQAGSVSIDGRALELWRPRDLARVVGVVSQFEDAVFPLPVRLSVALGRYAHLGALAMPGQRDEDLVREAMARAGVEVFAERMTDTLSGGEWQRVRIARALAQEPRALLLDEPTASLDVRYEMAVFELLGQLARGGMATLLVTHHLNLAARYATRMLLLERGQVAAQGKPSEVLTPEIVSRVFDWRVAVTTWCDGAPQVIPLKPDE